MFRGLVYVCVIYIDAKSMDRGRLQRITGLQEWIRPPRVEVQD